MRRECRNACEDKGRSQRIRFKAGGGGRGEIDVQVHVHAVAKEGVPLTVLGDAGS